MMKYRLSAMTPLTVELIQKYLDADRKNASRKNKLYEYYIGKHDITKRVLADAAKPNNKIVNPFPNYITDIMTGYFVGEPIKYASNDEELLSVVDAIFNYNDESAEDAELAKDASIMGEAYEIMYIDEDKQIRFKAISPIGAIPIYENTIEEEMLYFIRYYDENDILTNTKKQVVEVYTRREIIHYESSNYGSLREVGREPHYFKLVPVVDFYNNKEQLGDFEVVLSEIDAYDKLESDSINDMEYFTDAYLALYGMSGTTGEDIQQAKENRVLLMPVDAKAEWLTKNASDSTSENLKTRLVENIHKFSKCPSMTDKDFSANASGVAMKYKLMGLENATSKKERSFKKGLQRRLELLCNMLAVMGSVYDYRSIDIIFTRNIPANLVEIADVVNKLGDIVSNETKIDLLPIEIDYETEMKRKQEEAEAGYSIDFAEVEDNELLGEEN